MTGRSGSVLFLIEQLVVITVFAVCAAVCMKIFMDSYFTAKDTSALNNAVVAAASGAEAIKASDDAGQVAEFLYGYSVGGFEDVTVYYNEDWQNTAESSAEYTMQISFRRPDVLEGGDSPLVYGDISVNDAEGDIIYALTAAARWDGDE